MASKRLGVALAACVPLLASCGLGKVFPTADKTAAVPLPVVTSVAWSGGSSLRVLYVFATDAARQQGLQHRTLSGRSVAVFFWPGNKPVTDGFWMVNTPEPLSLLWLRAGRAVGHVEMSRCSLSCPTYTAPGAYDTALEAPAGMFVRVARGEAVTLS